MISENEYVRIAVITGAHSLAGMLKVYIVSDIHERFEQGSHVYLKTGVVYKRYIINGFRPLKARTALLGFDGITDRDSAEKLKGLDVFIDASTAEKARMNFDSGTFFYFDLIGCRVYLNDSMFGKVADVIDTGSSDLLVIENSGGKRFLIPFVESMVDTDRVSEKRIDIHPVEGLLDL